LEPGKVADAFTGTTQASRTGSRPHSDARNPAGDSGGQLDGALVAVGPGDLPEDREHLLRGPGAGLLLTSDREDAPDRLAASHGSQLDARMASRELGEERHSQTARDEALDHLVVLGLESDLRLEARLAAEVDHLETAGARLGAAEPLLVLEVLDPHGL